MSIVIPAGRSRTGITLPDAVEEAARARPRASAAAALVSYVACTAATAATAWSTHGDRSVGSAGTRGLWWSSWVAVGVAVLSTSAWTRQVGAAARRHGMPGVRSGRMAAGWFVPVVGPPWAIRQIGRLVRELDYSERRLGFWLFGLYAHTAALLAGSLVVASGSADRLEVLDVLRRQTGVLWLQAAMSAMLTVLAARAVLHADRALSRRR